jgi:hypothetical protein
MAFKEWDPEAAVQAMAAENDVFKDRTTEQAAAEILKQNAPAAALALCHLATDSLNENVRLKAASTVLERVLGKSGEPADKKDVLAELLEQMVNGG